MKLASTLICVVAVACQSTVRTAPQPAAPPSDQRRVVYGDSAGIAQARADSARYPYTRADVHFMTGMIAHHAQALEMARLAESHGAGAAVLRLAQRIINAQEDEIVTAQQWLADRLQPVPQVGEHGTHLPGHEGHHMMMPGMITQEQMRQLNQARGTDFDRLFLTYMIQHHEGAIEMVSQLFSSYGAGQDQIVFKFASDINVDQTTEVERMKLMLASLPPS
jgi:uncharacterized protein (DUF305 family)